ncbi:hypothetical protein AVEN_110985-1 [Araneus ventricosus]|uniref:Uncharacterized protein n=1 Tax=Araneus ventricosus TaxID=182803 RepID=A0A4Y1ZUP1_ARAVE|nr:hypothetical protein AVEN_110985-1 [Araneus ventricosus]
MGNSLPLSKTAMTAGTLRILRTCSPSPSGRATLTKKARAAGVKSITPNERGRKLHGDIRMSTVFCLKGRSRVDRVKRSGRQFEIRIVRTYGNPV